MFEENFLSLINAQLKKNVLKINLCLYKVAKYRKFLYFDIFKIVRFKIKKV